MILNNFDDFLRLILDARASVVALDMRGTLLRAPRGGHLARAFADSHISATTLKEMDQIVPGMVRDRYPYTASVVDWTLVTVLEAGMLATERGESPSSAILERGFQRLNCEYRTQSHPLVEDAALLETVRVLNRHGVTVILSADGPAQRERDVLNALFPRTAAHGVSVFSSEDAGVNKLSGAYFSRLATSQGVPTAAVVVVGDRLDKDVLPAIEAGCRAILIGETDLSIPQVSAFRSIAAAVHERLQEGLVLGRFQPLHLEHVRYLEAALTRVEHLVVGVTRPFDEVKEPGGPRNDRLANPIPYWLREQIVLDWAQRAGASGRVSVRPVPLTARSLQVLVKPGTPVLLTDVEPWSRDKRMLIEAAGYPVIVLEVGDKNVSGSQVRELIRQENLKWRQLVPRLSEELLTGLARFVVANDVES